MTFLTDTKSSRVFNILRGARGLSIVGFAYLLAACQTTQPGIEVREVPVPTPVRCVDPADIPPEPPQVSQRFNGDAKHDLGILAPNALELRSWGRTLRALIVPGCTTVE